MKNKILLLLLVNFLVVQDWEPFHLKDLRDNRNTQIDYNRIDNIAEQISVNNLNRPILTHTIIGYLPYWEYDQYPYLDYNLLTHINYFSAELDQFGNIINDNNWSNLSIVEFAHERGVKVKLCATLFGEESLRNFLSNPISRQNAINNLLELVINKNADGIDIDFELLPADQRDNLVLFIEELSMTFHNEIDDPIITMATPAIDWLDAWDYNELAEITDGLFIMGYNYFYSGSENAGPVSPLGGYYYDLEYTLNDYIEKTEGQLNKLILGLPYYGYDWPVIDNSINSLTTGYGIAQTYAQAEFLSEENEYNWNNGSNSVWFSYQDNNWQQCWYDDSLSLSIKYQFIKEREINGVGIWALGYDQGFDDLWGAINDNFTSFLVGDINLDQEVNIQDIILLITIIIEDGLYDINGDINNDYIIDVLDIIGVVNIILNRSN